MIELSKLITQADKDAKAAAEVTASMAAVTAKFRSDREGFLNRLSGIGFAAQIAVRPDIVQHVLDVRRGLLDLTTQPTVLAATTEAELKTAMLTCYYTLLFGMPDEIKAAFREIDQ